MTGEVEVVSYELLATRGRERLTKGGFCQPDCFNKSVEDRGRVLLFAKFNTKDRAQKAQAFLWLTDMEQGVFSVTKYRPHAGPSEASPSAWLGVQALACMDHGFSSGY